MALAKGPSAAAVVDIDATRAFLAVARRGGLTAAATEVGRTPAALSMQLKKLEEVLGATLFERGPRGMTLTSDGVRFEEHARKIMAAHNAALSAFRAEPLSGHVRVGAIDEYGERRLSQLLAEFADAQPEVCVSVVISSSIGLSNMLDAGELDLAMLAPGGDCLWREDDALIYNEPLVWIGKQGGLAASRSPVPVAIARVGCAWRRMAIDALDAAKIDYRIAYASNTYAGLLAAVAADLAVSPAPASALRPGFTILGAQSHLPELGECRIALRYAPSAQEQPETAALGAMLTNSFCIGRERGELVA
ncbi:MAG: LysR family transcriptional regulator [Neomegalonema sp.]|nr:LysR family transcriptional regulator [Neomegalonema sp.]